ncbi:MAG: bifunctional UDP-N-acetylglucosamine diphosphorylase/glucosamine-1-phosphate N-acetyltransferase GlmU [Nitrospiria bacterium]
MRPVDVVVLAAGLGTRMKSKRVKVLHSLCGKPMILHLLNRIKTLPVNRVILVLGHQSEKVKEAVLGTYAKTLFAYQSKQLGTGHALAQTEKLFYGMDRTILVLNGDTPLISHDTLISFIENHLKHDATLSLLSVKLDHPTGYGRMVRDKRGKLKKIVEEKDANSVEKKIQEVNAGIYLMDSKFVFDRIDRLKVNNAQKEYYLTDILAMAVDEKKRVESYISDNSEEVMGINSRLDLSRAEKVLRGRIAEKWMKEGVTLVDPDRTYIDDDVTIGFDTVIYPGVSILKASRIGDECTIYSNVTISNSEVKAKSTIKECCVISDAQIEEGVIIGPFAHLRPGTHLKKESHIGNFVEIKKSEIGERTKVNHLSYIGDSLLGKRVNVGAGTITCNYDGVQKHQTVIGDDVFIGSDTQFVAPVRVESGSLIGAGSTIIKNVPKDSLALSRSPQIIKKGWVAKKRQKNKN